MKKKITPPHYLRSFLKCDLQIFKGSILKFLLLLLLIMTFSNCQVEEEIVNETNQVALQYNEQVLLYLDQLKSKGTKDKSSKINALITQMDSNSLKTFNLNTTQQILIADVLSLPKLEDQTKIKLVFFLYENKIIRSRIMSFSNKNNVTDYNTLVLSVLNATKDKKQYTGTVSFYNPFQEIIQKNKYENGIMIENQVLSITNNDINAKTNGCIEWYWVTTYYSGRQTWDYMYSTCSCEENTYRVSTCGGGGGGGNGNTPSFPQVPTENQIIDFFSPEGEFIRYQFINNTWKIVLINLADVIVKTKPGKYSFLIFNYPVNQQKVYNDGMVYTFESEINTWSGVIEATDPCDQLKSQITNTNYQAKIVDLKGKTTLKKESGYMQKTDGSYHQLTNVGSDQLKFVIDATTVGFLHTHLDEYDTGTYDNEGNSIINQPIKMFSPADVKSFILLLINANKNNIPLSDVYGTMVSTKGVYQLRFEGSHADINLGINFDGLDEKYKKYFIKINNIEKAFSLFLKEQISIEGIKLFKINSNGTTEKKSLDINNKLESIPCQ